MATVQCIHIVHNNVQNQGRFSKLSGMRHLFATVKQAKPYGVPGHFTIFLYLICGFYLLENDKSLIFTVYITVSLRQFHKTLPKSSLNSKLNFHEVGVTHPLDAGQNIVPYQNPVFTHTLDFGKNGHYFANHLRYRP